MNLACWITSIRFLIAPLIFWQLATRSSSGIRGMVILLLLAGITDIADGWVARRFHQVSELGKALDPLTDKLVIFATLLGLSWWGLPLWLVILYFAKEAFQVLAGFLLFRKYQQLIPSNIWGKSSTVLFFIGFTLFFICNRQMGMMVITVATLDSIYALFTYYQAFTKIRQKESSKKT